MRARRTNFHSVSGTPASPSWRVALRSVLPCRIEKSSGEAPSSIGESANQSSQPQKPRTAAATARTRSFRRKSIQGAGELDGARIINAKRTTVDELASARRRPGDAARRTRRGELRRQAGSSGRPAFRRGRRRSVPPGTAELRRSGGAPRRREPGGVLQREGQDARQLPPVARRGRIHDGPVARPRRPGAKADCEIRAALEGQDRRRERVDRAPRRLGSARQAPRRVASRTSGIARRRKGAPRALRASGGWRSAGRASREFVAVALAGHSPGSSPGHRRHAGPARPPDGEPRADRRGELRQGLLHGAGDRRALAVSRQAEAAHVSRQRRRTGPRRRRPLQRRPRRAGERNGGERRGLSGGRLRSPRRGPGRQPRALESAPQRPRRAGPPLPAAALRGIVTTSYYVYYRVPPANAANARRAVDALQRELSDVTG